MEKKDQKRLSHELAAGNPYSAFALQKKLEGGLQADVTSFGLPGQDLVPLARDISFPVASDIEPIDKMKLKFGARKNGS